MKGTAADQRLFLYRIDAKDRITYVNPEWSDFARENQAEHLSRPGAVIGLTLWEFITDASTRHLLRLFLRRIRHSFDSVTIPFRCDSPGIRRFMESSIVPLQDQSVEFRCRVLREEIRPPIVLLLRRNETSDRIIMMCSWCKRIKVPRLGWVNIEEALVVSRLFNRHPMPGVSHGICPQCYDDMIGTLTREEL